MRLICPNCGAQYEVPDEVIPTSGRDVQCSNCGDTWFQHHRSHTPTASSADDLGPSPQEEDVPPTAPLSEKLDEDEHPDDYYDEDDDDIAQDKPGSGGAHPVRRGVNPAVADILRQEAERERQVRSSAGGIETQPDLGLSDPEISEDERTRQARARMERLRGASGASPSPEIEKQDAHASIDPSSRRNLLPDIEEINSSLTSSGDRSDAPMMPIPDEIEMPVRRGGFRSGFRLAIMTFALAALVYVFAPRLATTLPAMEAPLAQYVDAVNVARLWVASAVNATSDWLSDMSAPSG